jgi:hypothetical protein
MTELSKKILDHPVGQSLVDLQSIFSEISISPEEPIEVIENLERLKEITSSIQIRIKQANPILMTPPMLDSLSAIENSIQAIVIEVNQFRDDRDRGRLVTANSIADTALTSVYQLPPPPGIGDIEAIQEALNSFRLSALNYLKEIEDKRGTLNNRLSELSTNIDAATSSLSSKMDEKNTAISDQIASAESAASTKIDQVNEKITAQETRLDNIIAKYQEQFLQAENDRLNKFMEDQSSRSQKFEQLTSDLQTKSNESLEALSNKIAAAESAFSAQVDQVNEKITAQETRLDNIIAKYQEQFSQAESNRSQKFEQLTSDLQTKSNESLDSFKTQSAMLLSDSEKRFNELRSSFEANAQITLNTLDEYRIKAEGILNVTGSAAMAGDYQKVANRARIETYIWQVVVALSMIGLVGFAIFAFYATLADQIKWATFGGRVFVTVAFGILATWAVSQVKHYQEAEIRNRRYQLELSSIEPYLVGLPTEMKDKVKVELSQRLFGNTDIRLPAESKKVTGTSLDLVQSTLKILEELIKKSH